ncbi:aminopeptidase N-like isoform X2 [Prorops nasuta]|uniref:aminopeptidase N-like isoform X2 n=1 Tax=Prorops nasuta TaxID=863751 RepID=UPI0034CF7877
MRRGSITTWEPYARRSSANMGQLNSGSRTEFVPGDIKCHRDGGCFISYKKAAIISVIVTVCTIAIATIVWRLSSLPSKKVHDAHELITDEVVEEEVAAQSLVSPSIHPSRYILELAPVIENDTPTMFKGRVIIDFHVSSVINTISLNGRNISVKHYKLSRRENKVEIPAKVRRKRHAENKQISRGSTVLDETSFSNSPTIEQEERDKTVSINEESAQWLPSLEIERLEDSMGMENENQSSRMEEASKDSNEIKIKEMLVDNVTDLITLRPFQHFHQGYYTLDIDYEVLMDYQALYVANHSSNDKASKWFVMTNLKPIGARSLFPLFDDVRLKSSFHVSISHPKDMRALANMPVTTFRETTNNWIIETFEETTLLSPHNLGFVIGQMQVLHEFKHSSINNTPVEFWGHFGNPGELYLTDKISESVALLVERFSLPYPFPKLDFVAVPPTISNNVGNPGLISLKDCLFYATTQSTQIEKVSSLKAMVHFLGEQWLGGKVTMRNWTDQWIFEGSLIYLEHELIEKIDPTFESSCCFAAEVQAIAMDSDSYSVSPSLQSDVNPLYLAIPSTKDLYKKGACIIGMLHGIIESSTFWNGYRKFLARWNDEAADSKSFWSFMSEEHGNLADGQNLKDLMSPWTTQSGYPIVSVTRDYETASISVHQTQFSYDVLPDEDDHMWNIFLTFVDEYGDWSSPRSDWLHGESIRLDNITQTGNQSWIVFNVNKTGFYRVNYDDTNWWLLVAALEKNHESFPPETRASLIDDVFSLAAAGLVKYEIAMNVINYMPLKERHYAPWAVLMYQLHKLNLIMYDTYAYGDFQKFVLQFISPLYSEVSSAIKSADLLGVLVIQSACNFEHTSCSSWARKLFVRIKTDASILATMPAYLRETIYCTVAKDGGRDEWHYLLENAAKTFNKEEKIRLLSSFACFEAPWILKSTLNEIVYGNKFTNDEVEIILEAFPKHPAAVRIAYNYVHGNWNGILKKFSKSIAVLKYFVAAMANGLSSEQDLEDLNNFREENYDSMKNTRHAVGIVEAKAKFFTLWANNSLPELHNCLKDYKGFEISEEPVAV